MPPAFPDVNLSRRTLMKSAAAGAAVAAIGSRATASAQQVSGLPSGMALVSSPRLPLYGVSSADVANILNGTVPDWRELGSAVSLPVEPIALSSATPTATPAHAA